MSRLRRLALLPALCVLALPVLVLLARALPVRAADLPEAPARNTVTMLDLGAKSCIPCKMMIPVLSALEKDYVGRAAILFIDVWENPEQGKKYGLRAIPTQIFYDRQGKETFRHEGFMDQQAIAAVLDKLLAQ
ncbi:Thioredoxin [Fundidesulfovibrio magnetotacticus]|uniref:Thioredoxin n=1 Tax=Fundidesulfovibrio magnetotacticus TaxID=2730080 RepID=A0A6V8M0C8_9BACT|nr:thioredoxin family protein [Fundidesulfovibrio magnetotacticus]GFK95317.1 Thioredoxin [Fundidesulfovibrio magnetotacticus]